MSWQSQLKGDSLSWLLEPDTPGVRYLALRDLLDRAAERPRAARRAAGWPTPKAPSPPSWPRWIRRATGPSPARATTPSTAPPSGRSSCWPSWAPRRPRTSASPGPAPTCWTMPWRPAGSSRPPARPPARWTACRATCAGRCRSWAATTPGWKRPSSGWRAASPARALPQRRPPGAGALLCRQVRPAVCLRRRTTSCPAPGARSRSCWPSASGPPSAARR